MSDTETDDGADDETQSGEVGLFGSGNNKNTLWLIAGGVALWFITQNGSTDTQQTTADFTISPSDSVSSGTQLTLDASPSTGDITNFSWSLTDPTGTTFGPFEGTIDEGMATLAFGVTETGEWQITLTVTAADGSTDTVTKTITVGVTTQGARF